MEHCYYDVRVGARSDQRRMAARRYGRMLCALCVQERNSGPAPLVLHGTTSPPSRLVIEPMIWQEPRTEAEKSRGNTWGRMIVPTTHCEKAGRDRQEMVTERCAHLYAKRRGRSVIHGTRTPQQYDLKTFFPRSLCSMIPGGSKSCKWTIERVY